MCLWLKTMFPSIKNKGSTNEVAASSVRRRRTTFTLKLFLSKFYLLRCRRSHKLSVSRVNWTHWVKHKFWSLQANFWWVNKTSCLCFHAKLIWILWGDWRQSSHPLNCLFLLGSLLTSAPSSVETSTSTGSGDRLRQEGRGASTSLFSPPASTPPSVSTDDPPALWEPLSPEETRVGVTVYHGMNSMGSLEPRIWGDGGS